MQLIGISKLPRRRPAVLKQMEGGPRQRLFRHPFRRLPLLSTRPVRRRLWKRSSKSSKFSESWPTRKRELFRDLNIGIWKQRNRSSRSRKRSEEHTSELQ